MAALGRLQASSEAAARRNPRGARARRGGAAAGRRGDGQPRRRRSHQGHPRAHQGAARQQPELRLKVTSLWHNSFDDLLTTRPDEWPSGLRERVGRDDATQPRLVRFRERAGELRSRMPRRGAEIEDEDMLRPSRCSPASRKAASCATMRGRSAGSQIRSSRAS